MEVAGAVCALLDAIVSQVLALRDLKADAVELHRHLSSLQHLVKDIVHSPEGQQAIKTPGATRALSDLADSLRAFQGLITKIQNMKKCMRFLRAGDLLQEVRSAVQALDNKLQVLQLAMAMRTAGSQQLVLCNQEHLRQQFEATREGLRLTGLKLLQSYYRGAEQLQSRMEELLMGPGGTTERMEEAVKKAVQDALQRHGAGLDEADREDRRAALHQLQDKVAELRAAKEAHEAHYLEQIIKALGGAELRTNQQQQQHQHYQQQRQGQQRPNSTEPPGQVGGAQPIPQPGDEGVQQELGEPGNKNEVEQREVMKGERELFNECNSTTPNMTAVVQLLNQGVNVDYVDSDNIADNKDWYTCLHAAATNGHTRIMRLLLALGADANARTLACDSTPLHLAALCGHADACLLLLGEGADPTALDGKHKSPLDLARGNRHAAVVELLRKATEQLVHAAGGVAAHGRAPPQLPEAHTEDKLSLLSACMRGDLDTVLGLVDSGTAVNVVLDNDAAAPLHWCAEYGRGVVAAVLLKAGANPHAQTQCGVTPLHFVASPDLATSGPGHVVVARVLLAAGADPMAKDADGRTPLHWAASPGRSVNLEVVRALLAAGADPTARDAVGYTPRDLAKENKREELRALFN